MTLEDDYPRVMFTRKRHRRGVLYFGPYANAKKVRETLDVLNRVFRYRPCEGPKPGRRSGIPCLDYHIERCLAPCVGYVSREAYREVIDGVVEFLSGNDRPIRARARPADARGRGRRAVRGCRALPQPAARGRAARRAAGGRARLDRDDRRDRARGRAERAAVQVFPLRGGRMVDRYSFHLENAADDDPLEVLEGFCIEYYGAAPSIPPQILVPRGLGDLSTLEGFLSELRGSRVEVRAPERGEKRRLQELAQQNAELALSSRDARRGDEAAAARRGARGAPGGAEPRVAADPDRVLRHLEHPGRRRSSARWSCSRTGSRARAHYRKFAVRGQAGQDDFAAMAEVVSRRFARLAAGDATEDYDESFAATPNLVVIDGGKGQLAAALEAMAAYDLPRVAVVSLAKRVEEVFLPGRPDPVLLPEHSPGLQLLQRLRDEAHRFAITFHRTRRDAAARESMFDQLEGVGPGAPAGAPPPLRLGRARAGGERRGARRRAGRAGEDGAAHLRPATPGRPRLSDHRAEQAQPSEEAPRPGRGRAARPRRPLRPLEDVRQPPAPRREATPRDARLDPLRSSLGTALRSAFVVYALTAEHTVPTGDSGELIAAAYVLGVAHPPGYPLYTMLGYLATLLPGGSPALRMNLISGLFDAIAVGIVFLIVYRLVTSVPRHAPASRRWTPSWPRHRPRCYSRSRASSGRTRSWPRCSR